MKRFFSSVLLFGLGLTLAAPLEIVDGLGRKVSVNTPAERIVALSLTATEVLFDCGITPIGRPSSATVPQQTQNVPEIGSAYSPDPERLVGLRPDLLLGSVGTTAARARELAGLSIPLVITSDSSLQDIYDTYTLVGTLTGRVAQARSARERLQQRVKDVLAQVPKSGPRPKVLVLLAAGGQEFSATEKTYIGDLLEQLGAQNVAKGVPSLDPRQVGFVRLSLEQIVAANPDVILAFRSRTATGGYAPSPLASLENQAAFASLRAVANNRVHLLDDAPFVTAPGPRAVESLSKLLALLYPSKTNQPSR